MDGKKALGVDLSATPLVEIAPAVVEPTPVAKPRLSKAVLVSSVALIAIIEIVAALSATTPDPATGALAALIESLGLLLLATPILALIRSRFAAHTGLISGLGILGFQAECLIGGHTSFFAAPFLAVTAAVVALLGVSAAALARK